MTENILKKEARLKGMTIERLATKLGISRQTISNWISGKFRPSADMVLKLRVAGISDKAIANPSKEVE
jgi:transcriptional regulator with XRE-family HTH domain